MVGIVWVSVDSRSKENVFHKYEFDWSSFDVEPVISVGILLLRLTLYILLINSNFQMTSSSKWISNQNLLVARISWIAALHMGAVINIPSTNDNDSFSVRFLVVKIEFDAICHWSVCIRIISVGVCSTTPAHYDKSNERVYTPLLIIQLILNVIFSILRRK